jgi:cytochrome P450
MLSELENDPHPLLREMRATEPVCWAPELNAWLVTRYDLAVHVLRDSQTFTVDDPRFTTSRVTGPSMLSLDGAEHARHRKAFDRGLRPDALDRAAVQRRVSGLIKGLNGTAELRRELAGPLAAGVMADLLGLDATVPEILAWQADIVATVAGLAGDAGAGRHENASFSQLAASIRRAVSGERSALLAQAAGSLATEEIISDAAVLLFGGIETTEGMICNAIVHMLTYGCPGTEESLRLEPAAAMVDRYATRHVELGGAAIRAGDQVTVSVTGANRDPAVFADPDRYDPDRANAGRHLGFAHGPHFCIGASLARLETELAVAALPTAKLAEPPVIRGLVFRKPVRLLVRTGSPAGGPHAGADESPATTPARPHPLDGGR